MSVEVLLPSPRVNMLDTGTLKPMEGLALPTVCGPHRGIRRPSGTNDSESDSPPSKKSKKGRRRKKRPRQRLIGKALRTKPVAPFNTTQFLMAEHDQLQDTDIVVRPRRQRDSSFSVDSEDHEFFYSSPEDEDEFMAREFWNAYEDVHAERLDTMTKAQLVQEYLALEEKVDLLERQVRILRARHRQQKVEDEDDDDEEMRPGEVKVDSETAQKITIFQKEISSLTTENRKLREENLTLRRNSPARSSSSSSSSSSDSSSSSSSSSDSSSDSDSEDEHRTSKKTVVRLPLSRTPDEDEVLVSASDKVAFQSDTRLCQEEKFEAEIEEPRAAEATAAVQHDNLGSSPAHPDPPTSSTSVCPLEGDAAGDESFVKGVEEEVSSTTAA